MAPTDDDSSARSTPALPARSLPGKSDVDRPFRLDDEEAVQVDDPNRASAAPPPTFSSHNFPSRYFPAPSPPDPFRALVTECAAVESVLAASGPAPPAFEEDSSSAASPVEGGSRVVAETKAALPRDPKDAQAGSSKDPLEDAEPPPPYTEGGSPLTGFTYTMAVAGGAASVITQVQQASVGVAPISTSGLGSACLV